MTYSVKITGRDEPITVEMGQTILEAAISQGVPYPHGCRSGNCGACKSRLISGDVEMSPFSEFALTEDENLRDQETSSLWHPVTGESIQGPHKGKKLTGLIARYAVWFAWHSYRPDTHIHGE